MISRTPPPLRFWRAFEGRRVVLKARRSSPAQPNLLRGYALACVFLAAGYAIRWLADPLLGSEAPFLPFVLPVVAAVIVGGRGPGLLAGALSLVVGFTFVPQRDWGSAPTLAEAAIFIIVCAGIGLLGERLASEQQLADRARQAAETETVNARLAGEQLRLLLQAATRYAIILIDVEGNISTWNRGAKRLFGWSGGEIVGRHCSIFYPADGTEQERCGADLRRAADEGVLAEEA
jgi:two-component system sensor kinase FixL